MGNGRIILPLDGMSLEKAMAIARSLKNHTDLFWGFKVNDLVLDSGLEVVRHLKQITNVMVDLKLYDIPNTMNNFTDKIIGAGADIFTVHCTSSFNPENKYVADKVAGVTVLTSFDPATCHKVYGTTVLHMVLSFARMANDKNYGHLVCSAKDLPIIKGEFDGKKICPGIRPEWSVVEGDDQSRVVTPAKAMEAGADYLVIGRPILQAVDKIEALQKTNEEIENG